jgi:hypothetical protein
MIYTLNSSDCGCLAESFSTRLPTKIGRLNRRDWADIEFCIKEFSPSDSEIRIRAGLVTYARNQDVYDSGIEAVARRFFPKR